MQRISRIQKIVRVALAAVAAVSVIASASGAQAQAPAPAPEPGRGRALPFAPGEDLVYRVRMGRFGENGRGVMRVTQGEALRGRAAIRLHFKLRSKVAGLLTVVDSTTSWIDPESFTSLRYHKHEDTPISSGREEVEIYPSRGVWESRGDTLALGSDAPLDELSFLYYVRTLPLQDGDAYTLTRHFDPARNPVEVRVLRREVVKVPAGEFDAVVVEMRVTDPRRWGGHSTLRFALTDDEHRVPVRFEMPMPVAGTVVLSLESQAAPTARR